MRAPQPYSKKIYLASLALFWGGLCAGFLAVLLLSCRQSFAARTRALLDRQHTVAAALANDTAALLEEQRPQTVPALWRQTGRSLRDEGLALAVWRDGRCLYSDLALADLPEAAALAPGQRSWQVRVVGGRRLFYATTALAGSLSGYAVTLQADVEDFYVEWRRTALVFLTLGLALGAVFAAGLYAVLHRLGRPLRALTAAARGLAAGDYARRTGLPPRRDELGELAAVLDALAARVQRQTQELAAQAEAKQRMVDDLSHEMRTPLTAIGGYAEYLQLADVRGEERRRALETIRFESRRLLDLAEALLRLSVLQNEPLRAAPVDTAALLRRAAAAAAPRAEARGVRLLCAEPGPLPPLWGDAALLESLLVNLCDNGAKACAPGGQVELAAAADGGCTLTVRDNGCGMDADTLACLGQPFFRADKARARADGGAGLGVTLCYRIAAAHGAELTYSSRPGAGTVAAVRFPPGGREFTTLQQDGDPPVTPAP